MRLRLGGAHILSMDNALWFFYLAIEVVLVALLAKRRVWRYLPTFFLYCIWDILSNVGTLFVTRFYFGHYLTVYLAQTIIDSIFQFCILLELTWSLLRPLRVFMTQKMIAVLGALILLAGAAIWPFAAIQGLIRESREVHLLLQLQQTTAILRILFFLFLAAGSRFLSISWRDRELQVASGLGTFSIVNISVSVVQVHVNSGLLYARLQSLIVASFICCIGYWIYCFSRKEAERREFTPEMQRVLLALASAAHATRVSLDEMSQRKSGKNDRQ